MSVKEWLLYHELISERIDLIGWLALVGIVLLVIILLFFSYAVLGVLTTFSIVISLLLFYFIITHVMNESR